MEDITREFLVESQESLEQLDLDLVALERTPDDADTLARVFRSIHSIKGACGFLGFQRLEHVTHVGETLLGRLRDRELVLDAAITTALLKMLDAVRDMLGVIEADGNDGDRDYHEVIELLESSQHGDPSAASEAASPKPDDEELEFPAETASGSADAGADIKTEESEPATQPEAKPTPSGGGGGSGSARPASSMADTTVRVDVALLDDLMNQVGELVLARNQILQSSHAQEDPVFLATTQRLNLITSELQEGVMKTRMQPIGTIWNKLPRIVRDVAAQVGKKVRIEMDGEDTELDRTIIEAIKDPLTHVVRNSIDHGLEAPEVREQRGKPVEGCLRLRAFHEGGQVNLEISDDGAGIDTDRVRAKAVERGLATQDQVQRMSEREATSLVFSPGFSTASAVTNISGRGVGMDVVKTNIERIGGTLDIQSARGVGTTLRIKIPLTLAIVPALIVTCGGAAFAIPQISLLELVRFEGEQADAAIEWIHDVPVHRLRGDLLPLVWLDEQLRLRSPSVSETRKLPDDRCDLTIAVLHTDDRPFGLVVDEVNDNQEIVVKPLGKQLESLECFAGATIMGDGRVALILDAVGLASLARLESTSGDLARAMAQESAAIARRSARALLLFHISGDDRFAVPLADVARLEEIHVESIEYADGRPLVQYRGGIMPLLDLGGLFGRSKVDREGLKRWQVLVCARELDSVGLIIGGVIDVVEAELEIEGRVSRPGLRGTAVVQGKITEILDTAEILDHAGFTTSGAS